MIVMKSIRPPGAYHPLIRPDGEGNCLEIAVAIPTAGASRGLVAGLSRRLRQITYHAYADYQILLRREGERDPAILKPQPGTVPPGLPCSGRPMLGLYSTDPRYYGLPITRERLREMFGPVAGSYDGGLLVVEAIFTPRSLGDFEPGRYEIVYRGRLVSERLERTALGVIALYPPSRALQPEGPAWP